jgi:beta-glucosidase
VDTSAVGTHSVSCTATDKAGNSADASANYTVASPDLSPPTITPQVQCTLAGTGSWCRGDVTVSWTVTDPESAISSQSGCDPVTITTDTAGTVLTCEATSSGGTASESVTIKRDASAPSLAPSVSPNPVPIGGTATVTSGAADALSGLFSQPCGALDTSTAGVKSVTCTATDNADNSASASVTYTVVFPANGVLDNFNRANGQVGGNWEGLTGTGFYKIASNRLDVQLGGPLVWKPAAFGTSQEAFVTLSTIDSRSRSQGLLLKVQTGSVPNAGAIAAVYDAVARAVRVSTLQLGDPTWTPYASTPATFANGDQLGARALANGNVEIYKNGTLIATVTLSAADQAFFNGTGGKTGLWAVGALQASFDDFGEGTAMP